MILTINKIKVFILININKENKIKLTVLFQFENVEKG